MDEIAADRLVSGRAWKDFCDVLRQAGELIDEMDQDATDVDRAEWYRCVTRMLRVGCERYLENDEPYRPRLRLTPWRTSVNVQSPDQDHLLCELVDTSRRYRISGNRGTVPYFIIATLAIPNVPHPGAQDWAPLGLSGLDRFDPSKSRALTTISSDEITFDGNGDFSVELSNLGQDRDWLPLPTEAVGLIVRTVHHQRATETAPTFRIELIDRDQQRPCRPDEVSDALARAAQMTLGFANRVRQWKQDFEGRPNHLEFSLERHLAHGGIGDRRFAFGVWRKPVDQALVLQFTPPECEYWNFQLCNIWQENLDNYEDGQGYTTKFTAKSESDGSIRIVAADEDPGVGGNWIGTFGHTWGLMGLRFIKTGPPPPVLVQTVDLAALRHQGFDALNQVPALVTGSVIA